MTRTNTTIEVVAGVVYNNKDEVLVNQRTHPAAFRGKWEFPGGKIEPSETIAQALRRELMEELNIQTIEAEPLISITHKYPHGTVRLHVHKITEYRGEPRGKEGQVIQWLALDDLRTIDFLEANEPILNAVCLPHHYLITNTHKYGREYTLRRLETILEKTRCIVQVREKEMDIQTFKEFAEHVIKVCHSYGSSVLANAKPDVARALGCDGVHLSFAMLRELEARPGSRGCWVGASCHDQSEIKIAEQLPVDFAVLSPVLHTGSHPQASPMGWDQFSTICSDSRLPIYALGGVGFSDAGFARSMGAQGVAMVSAAWEGAKFKV